MWSQFSICDRTPPSSCEEAAVCSAAPASTHPNTYFRWLVLLAVTVTGKKTCVSCIYLTHFIDLFFLFLSLLILKPGKDTIVGEKTVAANNNLSGYAFSDQLLLYLIDFHLRKLFVLISTKLPLALADCSDTYYADKH